MEGVIAVERWFAGYSVRSEVVSIEVTPHSSGGLAFELLARATSQERPPPSPGPTLWSGARGPCFPPDCIELSATRLRCMVPHRAMHALSVGFELDLDSDMTAALRPLLPRLALVARTAAVIESKSGTRRREPVSAQDDAWAQLVARVLLDKVPPQKALALHRAIRAQLDVPDALVFEVLSAATPG